MRSADYWIHKKRFLFFFFSAILALSLSASQSNQIFAQAVSSSSATALQSRRGTSKATTTMRTRGRWHRFNGYQIRLLRVSGPRNRGSKGNRSNLSAEFYIRDTKNRRNSRSVSIRQWRESFVGNIGISPTKITNSSGKKGRARVTMRVLKRRR
jgi:hypothetical protein